MLVCRDFLCSKLLIVGRVGTNYVREASLEGVFTIYGEILAQKNPLHCGCVPTLIGTLSAEAPGSSRQLMPQS